MRYRDEIRREARRRLSKQAALQIYLPLIGGFLFALAAFLWVALRGRVNLASASNLSAALLAVPLLFFGLLGLVLVFFSLMAVAWLMANLPFYSGLLLKWVEQGAEIVRRVADVAAAPIILAKTASEYVRGSLRALGRDFHFPEDE